MLNQMYKNMEKDMETWFMQSLQRLLPTFVFRELRDLEQ